MTWWCRKRVDRGIKPGDYIHFNGRSSKFSEGGWGIIRVYDKEQADLKKLPAGFSIKGEIPKALPVCPADAPVKSFNVVALDYPAMKFNAKAPESIEVDFERKIQITNPDAKIYALEEDAAKVAERLASDAAHASRERRGLRESQSEEQDEGGQGVLLGDRIGVRSEGFDGRQRRQQPRRSDDRSRRRTDLYVLRGSVQR